MNLKTLSLAFAGILATSALAHATQPPLEAAAGSPGKALVQVAQASDGQSMSGHDGHVIKVGDLEIEMPFARATPPNAPVAGGYLTIRNTGSEPDRLIGGSAAFAGDVEVHDMAMENDVMKMRKLADGLEVPAGGEVTLKPGGMHLMFIQLGEQLKAGETRTATLRFEKAGEVEVPFAVQAIGAGGGTNHGHMDDGNMDEDGQMGHSGAGKDSAGQ